LFEETVLSKPYFDRHGLILAVEEGRTVGFVHAGFGPTTKLDSVCYQHGVISRLMVDGADDQLALKLLHQGEMYLQEKGAKAIYAGGNNPNDPFYLGYYGGSRLPGILGEDRSLMETFQTAGYTLMGEQVIMQCQLRGFRPRVDRKQMLIRRQFQIATSLDPASKSWWEACTIGCTDRTKFELLEKATGQRAGQVTFWNMVPLSKAWGINANGIFDLEVLVGQRRAGLGSFLVGEALKQLAEQGVALAEVQTRSDDEATIAFFQRIGFQEIERGAILKKLIP
jgi:ribosomal protein S18 acetylase RimI-like enzyme